MSQWIGFTNQKLYQCRLLLAQREQAADAVLSRALEESALYQLTDAWRSYLQELGDMVSFREPVTSLQDLLQRAPMVTGEMRELSQLADKPFSWLTQMLAAVPAQQQPDAVKAAVTAQPGRISLAQESSSSPVIQWWQELSRLIDAQRENRQES